jgi:zinc transporter ZupT
MSAMVQWVCVVVVYLTSTALIAHYLYLRAAGILNFGFGLEAVAALCIGVLAIVVWAIARTSSKKNKSWIFMLAGFVCTVVVMSWLNGHI